VGVLGLTQAIQDAEVVLLVGGLGYAAVADWRYREVTDRLWQVLGVLGFVLGAVVFGAGGLLPLVLWLVVGGLAVEHMFPWDEAFGPRYEGYADLLELVAYAAVAALVGAEASWVGVGNAGVPLGVIALLVTVVFARVLFEVGILYGGADAKALMISGLLVPLYTSPLWGPSGVLVPETSVVPFPVNLLMNAALLSLVVPMAVGARNLHRSEIDGVRTFTSYTIPVDELPNRFVWVRDPTFADARKEEEEVETSEDDRRRREEMARELSARGVRRVWVTPQVPFLVLMFAGAVAALLAGNLVVDLITVL
jgi:archaeal preflagellin peptidase FlaK